MVKRFFLVVATIATSVSAGTADLHLVDKKDALLGKQTGVGARYQDGPLYGSVTHNFRGKGTTFYVGGQLRF